MRTLALVVVVVLGTVVLAPGVDAGTDVRRGTLKEGDSTLTSGEFFDRHTVRVGFGERLVVRMRSDALNPYLIVKTPSEDEQFDNDDVAPGNPEAVVQIDDPVPGEWVVLATTSRPGEWGAYELVLETVPGAAPAGGSGTDRVEQGELAAGDPQYDSKEYYDVYPVELQPGQRLVVDMTSNVFDTYIGVKSPSGRSFANDDWQGSSRQSRVEIDVDEAGTWEVHATSYAPGEQGAYTLRISVGGGTPSTHTSNEPCCEFTGVLAPGDERLDSGEYYDVYPFTAQQGERVVIDLRATDFDPYLMLRADGFEGLDNDDYQGNLRHSQLAVRLPQGGEYRLYVTSARPGETGAYEMRVTREPTSVPVSQGPRSTTGTLAAGDTTLRGGEFYDSHTFEGAAGQQVRVELRSTAFDTYLMLVPPTGGVLQNDDFQRDKTRSVIETVLAESGRFEVIVTSFSTGETGAYELSIQLGQAPDTTTTPDTDLQALAAGTVQSGTLAPGDTQLVDGEYVDWYVFDAHAGQAISVTLTSSAFDTYLGVVTPDGTPVENDDDQGSQQRSLVALTARQAGRYRVAVTSYRAGESGPYQVLLALGGRRGPTVPPPTAPGTGRIRGVFVGVSDYGGRANNLRECAGDAERLHAALARTYGMQQADAVLLTDRAATADAVRAAMQRLGPLSGPDDLFVFFFSGHGAQVRRASPDRDDPQGWDETIECVDTHILDDEMDDLLGLVRGGTTLLVLDSCFSGGFAKDCVSTAGRVGLFSSEEDVTSLVPDKFEAGGYLAHFIVSAITNDRDVADDDGDHALTAIELPDYVYERYGQELRNTKDGSIQYTRVPRQGPPQRDLDRNTRGYQKLVIARAVPPDHVLFRWR
jgi:hypothetical protein